MNTELTQEQFARLMSVAYKAVSSTPNGIYGHGPGGTFSMPGLDRYVMNAMILPHLGLRARLPMFISNDMNPIFGILTGVTASTGSQPSGECDDFKQAGLAKLCMVSHPYGRYGLETTVANIEHAGELTNRGEFVDLQLIGNPVQNGSNVPQIPDLGSPLQNEAAKRLFEFGAAWSREYATIQYTGNPTNNTAGGGYKEYYGLQTLVNTGYRDAESAQACAAADSILVNFNNARINSAAANIVGTIQYTFFRLRHIAARAGLGTVDWKMVMPLGMFYQLTEIWAYYYLTQAINSITLPDGARANLSAQDVTAQRDLMRGNMATRTGQFLMVDGQRIDVIIDDALPETEVTPGVFRSDIYILPFTVMNGGFPVLFWNSYKYDVPGGAMDMARTFAPADSYYVTDNGTFLWHKPAPTNYCVQLKTVTRERLILRTPYIAARIQNVAWAPLGTHERSPFTDSGYFLDGGRQSRAGYGPSFWSPTA